MDVDDSMQQRADRWASTMRGAAEGHGIRLAHADSAAAAGASVGRLARQELEHELLATSATRAVGAGHRARPEEPDEWRTCFERDRDRILHAPAFRRLAGKTQVFVFPDDHQRTRLTHALEVAQVATSVARALGLNVALTEAIALGHDCGHGPGGHASDPAGPVSGVYRVHRGGSWNSPAGACRSALRNCQLDWYTGKATGMRLALVPQRAPLPVVGSAGKAQ